MQNNITEDITRAALVGVNTKYDDKDETEASLDELERLCETAGAQAALRIVQNKSVPDARTYIGQGKAKELKEFCRNNSVTLVIFDCELSPSQIKNLEDELGDGMRVIDRSMLILDIFARHATSTEGKLQVELAQLRYTIPRLIGHGGEMSKLGGGIGTRGPGESKLETDRRHLMRRIASLEEQLKELDADRALRRRAREKSNITKIAIAGYTNAGKSTLLNALTGAGILAEDKLFATLDPTTRKYTLPDGTPVLLTDTVGFIRNLPHHLIRAFRSTLDEVKYADVILVMIDASDPRCDEELEVTQKLLFDLGASCKPVLYVYNKCDIADSGFFGASSRIPKENTVYISAKTGIGLEKMQEALCRLCNRQKSKEIYMIPIAQQSVLSALYKYAVVHDVSWEEEYIVVSATVDDRVRGIMEKYLKRREDSNEE